MERINSSISTISSPLFNNPNEFDNESNDLTIRIKTLNNNDFNLKVHRDIRILDLKSEVRISTELPPENQRLIYRGKLLKDEDTLSSYQVEDGHTVHLVAKRTTMESNHIENNNESLRDRSTSSSSSSTADGISSLLESLSSLPRLQTSRNLGSRLGHVLNSNNTSANVNTNNQDTNQMEHIYQNLLTLQTLISTMSSNDFINNNNNGSTIEESKEEINMNALNRSYFIGQWIDVKDTVNQWLEATIIDIRPNELLIHYNGWPTRWDEWIHTTSNRLAPFRSRTIHTRQSSYHSPSPTTPLTSMPNGYNNSPTFNDILPHMHQIFQHIEPMVNQLTNLYRNQQESRRQHHIGNERINQHIEEKKEGNQPIEDNINEDLSELQCPLLPPMYTNENERYTESIPTCWEERANGTLRIGTIQSNSTRNISSDRNISVEPDSDDEIDSDFDFPLDDLDVEIPPLSSSFFNDVSSPQVSIEEDPPEEKEDSKEEKEKSIESQNQIVEIASNLAPLFDRLGRVMIDTASHLMKLSENNNQQERLDLSISSPREGNTTISNGISFRNLSSSHHRTQNNSNDNSSHLSSFRNLIVESNTNSRNEQRRSRGGIDIHVHAILAPIDMSRGFSLNSSIRNRIVSTQNQSNERNTLEESVTQSTNNIERTNTMEETTPLMSNYVTNNISSSSSSQLQTNMTNLVNEDEITNPLNDEQDDMESIEEDISLPELSTNQNQEVVFTRNEHEENVSEEIDSTRDSNVSQTSSNESFSSIGGTLMSVLRRSLGRYRSNERNS